MSKISLKELRMLIDTTSSDLYNKERLLKLNCTKVVQKVNGAEDFEISTPFEFDKEFKALEELRDNLARYEILAQEANTNIKVENMSLTEILKTLKSLRGKLSFYENFIEKKPYNKRVDVSNSGTFYYEVSELRFDPKQFEKDRDTIRAEIQKLEVALDKANTEPVIEI